MDSALNVGEMLSSVKTARYAVSAISWSLAETACSANFWQNRCEAEAGLAVVLLIRDKSKSGVLEFEETLPC